MKFKPWLLAVLALILLLLVVLLAGDCLQGWGGESGPYVYITQMGMGEVSPEPDSRHYKFNGNLVVAPAPGWRLHKVEILANDEDGNVEVIQLDQNTWQLDGNFWCNILVAFDTYAGKWGEGVDGLQFTNPQSIAFGDERIYITDENQVLVFGTDGGLLETWVLQHPLAAISAAEKAVYVVQPGNIFRNGKLLKLDLYGNLLKEWDFAGKKVTSVAASGQEAFLAVDGDIYRLDGSEDCTDQAWYSPDKANSYIQAEQIFLAGDSLAVFGNGINKDYHQTKEQKWLGSITLEGTLDFIYSSFTSSATAAERVLDNLFGNRDAPGYLAVDSNGYFYLTRSSHIIVLDSQGNLVVKWGAPGIEDGDFGIVSGIAVSANGTIYVLDREKKSVQYFNPVVP